MAANKMPTAQAGNPSAARLNPAPLADSPWHRAARRFIRHRPALFGAIAILFLLLVAVLAPVVAPYDPNDVNSDRRYQSPDSQNLFGTDKAGRDLLSRLIYGTRVSMSVGIVAVSIQVAIGFFMGALSGYLGGKVDMAIMRFTDVMMTFPTFVLALILVGVLGPSIFNVILALSLFTWPGLARLIRGQVLSLREYEFILAARAVGVGHLRMLGQHIFPNLIGPLMVATTLGMAGAILAETGLSFLGLGVRPPTATWGTLIRDARYIFTLSEMPWLWLPPGLAISLAVLSINFIGDGLRDAFDVRGRQALE